MKALSIRQPWAWLIVHGYKTLENRTWKLPEAMIGQRIVVHAGLKMGPGLDKVWIMDRLSAYGRNMFIHAENTGSFHLGALVGEVEIVRRFVARIDPPSPKWYMGPEAFWLHAARPYETPIPYPGHLGFFDIPEEVLA